MKPEIALITIGQSPRPDIVEEIKKAMDVKAKITEVGALDGLSRNEILSLESSPQDYRVVTRLSDAQPITISKKHISQPLFDLSKFHIALWERCDTF